ARSLLNAVERGERLTDDSRRQRRIAETVGVLLPVVEAPAEEIADLVALPRVVVVAIQQHPRQRDDGIGVGSRWIRDVETQVVRTRHPRERGRGALGLGPDDLAGAILEPRRLECGLAGEFISDVADRSDCLLDPSGNALVAGRAHRIARPVDERRGAGLATPGL